MNAGRHILILFIIGAGASTPQMDALSEYEPLFGSFVECDDMHCATEAFGAFDKFVPPWMHHEDLGWIYAEPDVLGNWFHAVEAGWWFSRAEWLPWIWSDYWGWCYHTVSKGIVPVVEKPLPLNPNILVILTDDLGYADLGCYGATDFSTPAIDRLAASGVRFTDGYVTSPQCGPSRASLISGVQPLRFGYIHNSSHEGLPEREKAPTIAEHLRERGYTTGMIGKWHIGFVLSDESGEYGATLPGNYPWERGFDYVLKHDGGGSHYFPYNETGRQWMLSRGREPRLREKREHWTEPDFVEDLSPDTYLTDYFSDEAVRFIHRNQEEPWFLFLSYNAPHTPMNAKPEVLEQYAHIEDSLRRTFVAMMDSLDQGIAQVMEALKETGQFENTLVWFLSDNGAPTAQNASRNDPFSGLKGDMHEGGDPRAVHRLLAGNDSVGEGVDGSGDFAGHIADISGCGGDGFVAGSV